MSEIRLLDCTLRDGGHVNEARFGEKVIHNIVNSLTESEIDFVELGFLRDGEFTNDETNSSYIEKTRKTIGKNNKRTRYTVMIRPDWYNISKLSANDGTIDFIRFAFYLKDMELTKNYCVKAQELGYKCILNPVNIMGYTDKDLDILLDFIVEIHPYGVTMVDTFGAMQIEELEKIYYLFESRLPKDVSIGLHLHENMASAYLLAQHFLKIKKSKRKCIIDGSLWGMGRIPGNLCIEEMVGFLNDKFHMKYNIYPLLRCISEDIAPIKSRIPWGYSPAYYFTAKYKVHRSYAEYYLNNTDLKLDEIVKIIENLKDDPNKAFFSEKYAEELLTNC